MDDTISRQAAIDTVEYGITYAKAINKSTGAVEELFKEGNTALNEAAERLKELPSAQEWIPITTRPMTEDERKEWSEKLDFNINDDEAIIYCNLPDDGQSVLIYKEYSKTVDIDTFCDDDDGCYFEDNGDMDGITHWMPLPSTEGLNET